MARIIWELIPYAFGLAAYIYGRNSATAARNAENPSFALADRIAAEMRRYSSKQNAVAFGILALFLSFILMLFENLLRNPPALD